MPREPITITLPDGSTRDGTSYETSPMSIALAISKGLADRTVIAKVGHTRLSRRLEGARSPRSSSSQVDGELWDLERPFTKSCSLELLDFEHPEGKLGLILAIERQASAD